MSAHIEAKKNEVAGKILLPGDPLRAKYIAENFLEGVICYNQVRGMLGFTGTYKGERISVQGTGMGMPSASIYIHELIHDYGVRKLVRVGTCGGIQDDVKIRDLIIAQSACTDSAMNHNLCAGVRYTPIGNFDLILRAHEIALSKGLHIRVGNVFSSDTFYSDSLDTLKVLGRYGVLAVEMETAALYTLAAKFGIEALSLLTVSDHVFTGEETSAMERQTSFNHMIEVGLEAIL